MGDLRGVQSSSEDGGCNRGFRPPRRDVARRARVVGRAPQCLDRCSEGSRPTAEHNPPVLRVRIPLNCYARSDFIRKIRQPPRHVSLRHALALYASRSSSAPRHVHRDRAPPSAAAPTCPPTSVARAPAGTRPSSPWTRSTSTYSGVVPARGPLRRVPARAVSPEVTKTLLRKPTSTRPQRWPSRERGAGPRMLWRTCPPCGLSASSHIRASRPHSRRCGSQPPLATAARSWPGMPGMALAPRMGPCSTVPSAPLSPSP